MDTALAMLLAALLTLLLARPVDVIIRPREAPPARCYYGSIQTTLRCPTPPARRP